VSPAVGRVGGPGPRARLIAGALKPNAQAVNLSVSLMLAVALVVVAGWLVVSVNKIDALEKSLEQSRLELRKISQAAAMSESEIDDYLDQVQAGLAAVDKRIKVIEGRLNIGEANRVAGQAGTAIQTPPPTRRIIQNDGSLVIKTPLVE